MRIASVPPVRDATVTGNVSSAKKGIAMPQKYNPAPVDEHAMDLKEALRSDKKSHDKVEKGLQYAFRLRTP
jgi:hypothetical protein